jgi:potassium voltage-gated channel Eag-related subfamily H protein 8
MEPLPPPTPTTPVIGLSWAVSSGTNTTCVCKVLERMINMRISWWLEKNHKFSETQYGFRRNKGCTGNLAILTTEIIKAFEERNKVSALFLDIKSAYDNVYCGT